MSGLVHQTLQFPIPAFTSQSSNNKSYLVCVKNEKYAFLAGFWVTIRDLESTGRGKAKLHTLQ